MECVRVQDNPGGGILSVILIYRQLIPWDTINIRTFIDLADVSP